jgi:hypothetical protein
MEEAEPDENGVQLITPAQAAQAQAQGTQRTHAQKHNNRTCTKTTTKKKTNKKIADIKKNCHEMERKKITCIS